ncbi:MAG: protein kinase [Gemmataceae bacterium]
MPSDPVPTGDGSSAVAPTSQTTQGYLPSGAGRGGPPAVRVPGYTVLEVLGRGGMGVVYKARQDKANRLVALKMILSGAHASDAERQRFQAEAEAVALLAHPNIVQVYEVGETPDGHGFFSLEYVPGGTLATRLRGGPLSAADAAALIESLARAMQHAHERGIIHRDLKPQNILMVESAAPSSEQQTMRASASGSAGSSATLASGSSTSTARRLSGALAAKISDFGLAKRRESAGGETRSGAVMGTPTYMAPEQAFGHSKDAGPAADIYSLGAILYECLTGQPPFRGATVADLLEQVRTREPVAPRELARKTPLDLQTICLHCLRKEPERRYVSALALAEDLERFRDGRPILVRPVGKVERVWRWSRRNPRWAAMIAAVVLLLCGVTGVSLYAYFTVAAKNDAITKESEEKEKARLLAEQRLLQSIDAVSLFARDARIFCEDAMVPAGSRQQLYEVLIKQLEKNVDEKEGAFDEDRIRNKILMYQQIAQVNADLGGKERLVKAREWDEKGLALTERWLEAKPGDPAARSQLGVADQRAGDKKKADAKYKEALDIRRELWSNPEYRKQIDKFTPGKSYTNLCDSLDTHQLFDESLKLREEAYREFGTFELLDAWCWTCWKAGWYAQDYSTKKPHLAKSVELSDQLHKLRPTSRGVVKRWAFVLRDLGELEFNHGDVAEAEKHYRRLAEVTGMLATAPDLARQRQSYARAWYTLGRVEKTRGHDAEAEALRSLPVDPGRTAARLPRLRHLRASRDRLAVRPGRPGGARAGDEKSGRASRRARCRQQHPVSPGVHLFAQRSGSGRGATSHAAERRRPGAGSRLPRQGARLDRAGPQTRQPGVLQHADRRRPGADPLGPAARADADGL